MCTLLCFTTHANANEWSFDHVGSTPGRVPMGFVLIYNGQVKLVLQIIYCVF